jgi:threonine dehydrogenase-like Zn-dependent dehydrogenase
LRALTFHGRHTVRVEEVRDPTLAAPTDALVRVTLAAICGSDLHPYHERERGLDPGTVMGHEFVGEVVETGREVRSFRPGDRVLSPFTTSCGGCFYCRHGLTARCTAGQLFGWVHDGVGLQGGQAGYVRVPLADGTLVRIPDAVGEDDALLLGDVLPTGFYCARQAAVGPRGTYVVVGCGPVGLMAIVGALELGATPGRLFAVDSVPERLALAERLGAVPLDGARVDPVARVRDVTEGRGADGVLEAVGSAVAGRLALDLVRPGGTISVVGVHTAPSFPFSPVEAYDKNLTFRIGRCPARGLIDELVPMVLSGRREIAAVISHRLSLEDGPRGYEIFDRKLDGCTKVVLRPS